MTFRALLLLLSASAASLAQPLELYLHGGVSRLNNTDLGGFSDGASFTRYALKSGWRFGFRTTFNTWRYIGQEFGYAYNRTQLRNVTENTEFGMAIHQGFYNIVFHATSEGSPVRPFAAVGGHFNNYTPPGTSVTSGGGSTKLGFNYGGGVKFRVSNIFGVRFDVRNYQNGKPFGFLDNRKGLMGQLEVSAGFGLVI